MSRGEGRRTFTTQCSGGMPGSLRVFFIQMRSTKGIGERDNGVKGGLHGLGDPFGLADVRHRAAPTPSRGMFATNPARQTKGVDTGAGRSAPCGDRRRV